PMPRARCGRECRQNRSTGPRPSFSFHQNPFSPPPRFSCPHRPNLGLRRGRHVFFCLIVPACGRGPIPRFSPPPARRNTIPPRRRGFLAPIVRTLVSAAGVTYFFD